MGEKDNDKAIRLLAIRNASGIKERIEEQQKLKDTTRKYILREKDKNSSTGKTNQDKIEEYKDKYKYNAFDVMFLIPALVKYLLNKNKSDKLKQLNDDIDKKVEEQINTTAKAFYGNDQEMDEARRQEMAAKMKNNVNNLVGKIIEKNNDLAENMEKSGLMLDESGLKNMLIAQIQEVVNNDPSLQGYFQVPGQPVQTAQVGQRVDADKLKEIRGEERKDLRDVNDNSILAAFNEHIQKGEVIVNQRQLHLLNIQDNSIHTLKANHNIQFKIKEKTNDGAVIARL